MPRVQNMFATIYRLYMIALSRAVGTELARIDAMNERIRMRLLFEARRPGSRLRGGRLHPST